jgi:crotonobetainyl-CoA:carnitine CoA-transferase CaiB-like acyl-CoA transferase
MMVMNINSPLSHLKILDLGRLLPNDYGTMLLADLGADVLKIEEPGKGDYMRWMPPMFEGLGLLFLLSNRNKKSLTLDLRHKEGLNIFYQLLKDYDCVIESFRPDVKEKLEIGYENLKRVNPKVIMVSFTGFGQTGPTRNRPGHDLNYLGIAGCLAPLGSDSSPPTLPNLPIADMTGGAFLAMSVMAAVIHRVFTGEGQAIDLSIMDCMVSFNLVNQANMIAKGIGQSAFPIYGQVPCYGIYRTRDGRYLTLGLIEEKFWQNFCRAILREDLSDKQYETGPMGDKVRKEIKEIIEKKNLSEWLEILENQDICYGPVLWPDEALKDSHSMARDLLVSLDFKGKNLPQANFPIKFSKSNITVQTPPPILGQHNNEVLTGLGYSIDEIEGLRKKGTI